jgi:hypothetical protein
MIGRMGRTVRRRFEDGIAERVGENNRTMGDVAGETCIHIDRAEERTRHNRRSRARDGRV